MFVSADFGRNRDPARAEEDPEPMMHVAIVHGPSEFSLGNALRRELEGGGVACWFGPRDLLAGAPTLDGQRDAVREARVVAVVIPPGDGPFETYIEDALSAARFGAVVVPVPADADATAAQGSFADAVARIRAAVAGAPPPPSERAPYPLPSPARGRGHGRGRGIVAVAVPVLVAALASAAILSVWAAAPTTLARVAKRFEAVPVINVAHLRGPEVAVSGSRSNQGWTLMLHLHDPVKRIDYRLDSMSEFETTGVSDAIRDHDTLEPMAKTWFDAGQLRRPTVIEVRFVDKDGNRHGPFKLRFDPLAEEVKSARERLSAKNEKWVHAQRILGKNHLYFAVLWQKAGIRSIHYGFDGRRPDTNLFFVPDSQGKSSDRDDYHFAAPVGSRSITMDVELKDGSHLVRQFSIVPDEDESERG